MRRFLFMALGASVAACPDSGSSGSPSSPSSRGDGGAPTSAIARISAPSEGAFGMPLVLDGSASSPAGVSFSWRLLEAPDGSHAFETEGGQQARLTPMGLGTFVVELTVAAGSLSDSTRASIDVGCGSPVVPEPLMPGGSLALTDRAPSGCPDYAFPDGFLIPAGATFEVGPAVEIVMGAGTTLTSTRASVQLVGDRARGPVLVRGMEERPGTWRGLRLSDAVVAQLRDVELRHAGSRGAVISVERASTLQMRRVAILESRGVGMRLARESEMVDYGENTFGADLEAPVELPLTRLPQLASAVDTHLGTAPYRARGDFLARPMTLPRSSVPYRFVGEDGSARIRLFADLRVESGAVLEVEPDFGLEFALGRFEFAGTSEAKVELRGADGARWPGILVSSGGTAVFEHVDLRGGGGTGEGFDPAPPAALTVLTSTTATTTPSSAELRNVSVEAPSGQAVWGDERSRVDCDSVATPGSTSPGCP